MGVRVTSGRDPPGRLRFRVANGRATGDMTLMYDSLTVEIVDQGPTKERAGRETQDFIAKNLMMRGSNMPDDKGKLDPAADLLPIQTGGDLLGRNLAVLEERPNQDDQEVVNSRSAWSRIQ